MLLEISVRILYPLLNKLKHNNAKNLGALVTSTAMAYLSSL
jgi:hypothetical protein